LDTLPSITVSIETLARMVEVYVGRAKSSKSAIIERNLEGMKHLFKSALLLSFGWNIFLVIGVIANQEYALTRAGGGQFESFPTGIRIAYCLTLVLLIFQAEILFSSRKRPPALYAIFFFLSCSSVFVNAISRSADERWNVIPAFIIATAFFKKWRAR
jgi:hypothetical protein